MAAQGNALGIRPRKHFQPCKGAIGPHARVFRPFRALMSHCILTQGVALGFHIPPFQGVKAFSVCPSNHQLREGEPLDLRLQPSDLSNYLRTRSTGVSPVSSMAILAMVSTFARAGRP